MKWNDTGSCLEVATCFPAECSQNDLIENKLTVKGIRHNKYIHGEEISVSCDYDYEFENDEDSIFIQCRYGKWKSRKDEKIPKCLRYFDCSFQETANMTLSGDNIKRNSGNNVTIEHDSTAR